MNKTILVIDDEQAIRKSFEYTFEDTEFSITTAESGQKGIDIFAQEHVDLVFLDLKMPKMDGVDTLLELRKIKTDVQIYIFTAFQKDFFARLKEARQQGLNFDILQKPLAGEELVTIARKVFN